ncbi:MAG: hypothetical protein ACT4QG_19705 [Sporichthyaceae bacterium]
MRLVRSVAVVAAGALAFGLCTEAGAAASVEAALPHGQVSLGQQAPPRPVCLKIAPSKKPKQTSKSRTFGKRKTGCKKGLVRTVVPETQIPTS